MHLLRYGLRAFFFLFAALALVQNHPTGYPVRTQTSRFPKTRRAGLKRPT